jgi:hypothetical protein
MKSGMQDQIRQIRNANLPLFTTARSLAHDDRSKLRADQL